MTPLVHMADIDSVVIDVTTVVVKINSIACPRKKKHTYVISLSILSEKKITIT